MNPANLTASQMLNVAYALLVRDQASQVDRQRLDEILSGKMPLPTGPEMDDWQPSAPPWGSREPTQAELDALRESWGRDTRARASQEEVQRMMETLPPMG